MTQLNRLSRLPTSVRRNRKVAAGHSYAAAAVVAAGVLAATAFLNRHLAKKAEHDNPPTGQFLEVDGVRLHYVERGSGEALVLLHGNGSMIQDSNPADTPTERIRNRRPGRYRGSSEPEIHSSAGNMWQLIRIKDDSGVLR